MNDGKNPKRGNGTPMSDRTATSTRPSAKEARQKSEWIGKQLRDFYDETLSEPVPDRFIELLRELDKKTGKPE